MHENSGGCSGTNTLRCFHAQALPCVALSKPLAGFIPLSDRKSVPSAYIIDDRIREIARFGRRGPSPNAIAGIVRGPRL